MAAAATTAAGAPASAPPASPSKRPLGKRPPPPPPSVSPPGSSGRRRQRIGLHPNYEGSSVGTGSSEGTGSILHRLPAPALALLPVLLPTASLLAAASADRACRAALLGEVTRLRLTATPLVRDPAAAGATAAMQIAGLLRRCPSLRRLEGPFHHHQGLQQSVGQALALLPTPPRGIEALVGVSSSFSSSSPSPMGPALRRSRLWSLYAHQQRPAAPALLDAAAKGRLPGLTRLDLGALGVPYLDDCAGPTAAAAATVFGRLGQGAWPGLSAVALGPGVYSSLAASPSASLAEGVVEALARRRALAASGAVAPLEELRFQRLRDYGEEEQGVGRGGHRDGQQQQHNHQQLQQLQLRVHVDAQEDNGEDEEEGQWQDEDDDKENARFRFPSSFDSPPASPRTPGLLPALASPFSSPFSSPRPSSSSSQYSSTSSPASPTAAAAAAAEAITPDVDAGADWRVVEGALASIDAKALRVLEVTGGCARKSQRWGKAVARLLSEDGGGGCPALLELALTPDAAIGAVAAALGAGTAAPGLKRLRLKAPEALYGATAAGSLRGPVLPSAAVRALGAAFEQGGLAGLVSVSLDGAAEGAAVAAVLAGMMEGSRARGGSARALEELLLPLPLRHESDDDREEEDGGAATTAPLLALAACLRAGCLPSLRRLRLPVAGAIKPGGAWAALLGALQQAAAPHLEEVVMVGDGDGDGEEAAALVSAVQGALQGTMVTWC